MTEYEVHELLTFSNVIHTYKSAYEMTNHQLAEAFGVTDGTVNNWLRGKYTPNLADKQLIERIASVLHLTIRNVADVILRQLGYDACITSLHNQYYDVFRSDKTAFFEFTAVESKSFFENPMSAAQRIKFSFETQFGQKIDESKLRTFITHIANSRERYPRFDPSIFSDEDLWSFLNIAYKFDINRIMSLKATWCLLCNNMDKLPRLCMKYKDDDDIDRYVISRFEKDGDFVSAIPVYDLAYELKKIKVHEFQLLCSTLNHFKSDFPDDDWYTDTFIFSLKNCIDIDKDVIEFYMILSGYLLDLHCHDNPNLKYGCSKEDKECIELYKTNQSIYEKMLNVHTDNELAVIMCNCRIPVLTRKAELLIELYEKTHLSDITSERACGYNYSFDKYVDQEVCVEAVISSCDPAFCSYSEKVNMLRDVYINGKYEEYTSIYISDDHLSLFDDIPVGSRVIVYGKFVQKDADPKFYVSWLDEPYTYHEVSFIPSKVEHVSK